MKKQFTKKAVAMILGIIFAVGASYVNALNRPSTTATGYPQVLNAGTSTQIKGTDSRCLSAGNCSSQISLKSLLVGDFSSGTSVNNFVVDSLGAVGIGTGATSSGIALDILGTTGIKGSIRSSELVSSGTRTVCANADGKIILCGKNEFTVSNTSHKTEYTAFMVPEGVTKITVEVYGAGGAGYGTDNDGSSDGDSSYFKGSGVNLFAYGGEGSKQSDTGGKGGGYSSVGSGLSIISNLSSVTGGNGEGVAPSSFDGYEIGTKRKCSGTWYHTIQGGGGGEGGKGGSVNGGDRVYGATGGLPGVTDSSSLPSGWTSWSFTTSDACNHTDATTDSMLYSYGSNYKNHRPGANGSDGTKGQGGAGFGGKGGYSLFTSENVTTCPTASGYEGCFGGPGASGGGGGGYMKADVAVSAGQTFYIKIGGAGVRKDKQLCTSGELYCDETARRNDQLGGGAISGNGGDGYVKITY